MYTYKLLTIKSIVFDLDGTLVDSVADIAIAASQALHYWGLSIKSSDFEPNARFIQDTLYSLGYGLAHTVQALAQKYISNWTQFPQDRIKRGIELAQQYYIDNPIYATKPFDKVLDMLQVLVSLGIKISILSNKDEEVVNLVVKHLFGNVPWYKVSGVGADGIKKPQANAFASVVPNTCIMPTSKIMGAVMVGDMDIDIQTAIDASVPFVGAGWGYYNATIQAKDHIVLYNPLDLIESFYFPQ